MELITRNYWWPGITRFVIEYIKGCDKCQRYKNHPELPAGKLKPLEVPSGPWKSISADFIVKLPQAQGFDSILVTVCRATKQAHFIPTTEEISARGTAILFKENVWKLHGLPEEIVTDMDPRFASNFMKELNSILGIKIKLSTPYHPQSDGQTERVNQELEQYLRLFISHQQDDWPLWLSMAEFSYNNRVHTTTRVTPFYANYGFHPRMGFEPRREGRVEEVNDFTKQMMKVHEEVQAAMTRAQNAMKRHADRNRGETPIYKIRDKVMISSHNYNINRPSRKLAEKLMGPFEIVELYLPNAIKVKLPRGIKIDPRVNVSRVRPYHEPTIPGQRNPTPPPLEVYQDSLRYEVERIEDSRLRRGRLEYLIKWRGFTEDNNTWEPATNVDQAPQAVADFYKRHPGAPRQIPRIIFNNLEFKPYENLTTLTIHTEPPRQSQ